MREGQTRFPFSLCSLMLHFHVSDALNLSVSAGILALDIFKILVEWLLPSQVLI